MLVLTRKVGDRIVIDGGIVIEVTDITRSQVRIAIDAPRELRIVREELIVDREPRSDTAGEEGE